MGRWPEPRWIHRRQVKWTGEGKACSRIRGRSHRCFPLSRAIVARSSDRSLSSGRNFRSRHDHTVSRDPAFRPARHLDRAPRTGAFPCGNAFDLRRQLARNPRCRRVRRVLWVEIAGVPVYATLAVLGLRRSPWFLAAGIAGHGLAWDSWHYYANTGYIPSWYAIGCFLVDLGLGLYIAARIPAWQRAEGPEFAKTAKIA